MTLPRQWPQGWPSLPLSAAPASGEVGRADETDSALAIAGVQLRGAGVAAETSASLALVAVQSALVGRASEADTALALLAAGPVTVGVAEETNTAFALLPGSAQTGQDGGRRRRLKLGKREEPVKIEALAPQPKVAPKHVQPVLPTAPAQVQEPVIAQAVAEVMARLPRVNRADILRADAKETAKHLQLAEAALMERAHQALKERQRIEIEEDNAAAANAALMLLMA